MFRFLSDSVAPEVWTVRSRWTVKSLHFLSFILILRTELVAGTRENPSKKTYILNVDDSLKPSVFPAHFDWYASSFVSSPIHILHTYSNVFSGFSARLTPSEVANLQNHPAVVAVLEDRRRLLHTTRSPQFLGLHTRQGLWSESDYGSDVVIGVLDTGIWPSRRSFNDIGLPQVPPTWKGRCVNAKGFPAKLCNKKLVGASWFGKGHLAASATRSINTSVEYWSPLDADGHGTHTASTAAGRYAFNSSMAGYAAGIAKGVAPKARLAVYKVCWKNNGCFDSDIMAGFDQAIKDGVNVISISIGGGNGVAAPYYLDPIAIGSFAAVSKGIFVSSSAGNSGPDHMSATNLAPWLTTVGASTIDRSFPASVVLGNGQKIKGVSLYSGKAIAGASYPLVYFGNKDGVAASLCIENSLDPELVKGKIVICDRGSNPRIAKGVVVRKANGVGMILANGQSDGQGLVGDAHVLPACAVGFIEGALIKAYVSSESNPTATIEFQGTQIGVKPAPVVASFSGRGPNSLSPEIIKPDLVAPGVNILAAWTDAVGPTGLKWDRRKTEYNILSGTSMACPHVSGAAALLKSAHPNWSPAAIRSAMMTTARIIDNRRLRLTDESTGKRSSPFGYGAGHLNLDQAMDPGLVYDIKADDYVNFLCASGYDPRTIQVISRGVSCPAKAAPEDLNYPSFSVVCGSLSAGNCTKTFQRKVTNVGHPNSTYKVTVKSPLGMVVRVKPVNLVFSEKIQTQQYVVTVSGDAKNTRAKKMGGCFGHLMWSDAVHKVRSTIAVSLSFLS